MKYYMMIGLMKQNFYVKEHIEEKNLKRLIKFIFSVKFNYQKMQIFMLICNKGKIKIPVKSSRNFTKSDVCTMYI